MGRLSEIDWSLVQFKYEVLGSSLEEIKEEYDLSEGHLAYVSKDWKVIPAAAKKKLEFADLSSLESLTDDIAGQISQEASLLQTLKQRSLLTKYLELENILLTKAITLAQELTNEGTSVNRLSTLTGVLTNLLAHNPLLSPKVDETSGEGEARDWTLTIVEPEFDTSKKTGAAVSEEEKV